jgi:hypothetical protein
MIMLVNKLKQVNPNKPFVELLKEEATLDWICSNIEHETS